MGAASNDSTMKVSKEEMKRAGIDLAYRDFCAHLLIPLNECRRKSFFLPWKCGDERHAYEKCQYEECAIASSTNASKIFSSSFRRRFLRSAFPFVPLRACSRTLHADFYKTTWLMMTFPKQQLSFKGTWNAWEWWKSNEEKNRKKERKTKGSLEGPFREDVCVVLVCERDVVCIYIYIIKRVRRMSVRYICSISKRSTKLGLWLN